MATDKAGYGDKYDSKISDQANKQYDKVGSAGRPPIERNLADKDDRTSAAASRRVSLVFAPSCNEPSSSSPLAAIAMHPSLE